MFALIAALVIGFCGDRVSVVVFLGTECPMAKLYTGRLNDLNRKYEQVGFCALNASNQDDQAELGRLGLEFPFLKDVGFTAADNLGATRSPEVFVFLDGVVKYRGRIDDQYTPGANRGEPTRDHLEIAIQELLAGKSVSVPVTEPAGCRITRPKKATAQAVTYSDVAPILHRRCAECHRPSQVAPFSLLSYEDTLGWREMMKEVIENKRMPPWGAEGGHWANDRSLTEGERATLLAWLDAGSPRGAGIPSVPPPIRQAFDPDAVLTAEPFMVPAEGILDYQEFVLPGFSDDRWVSHIEVWPGNPAVVHHIAVFVRPRGSKPNSIYLDEAKDYYLAAMIPGSMVTSFPAGMAKKIAAGTEIVLSIHYVPNGTPQKDQSRLALKFTDHVEHQVATRVLLDWGFTIPPNSTKTIEKSWTTERDYLLLATYPHAHLRCKSALFEATFPCGSTETLLNVARYDFNWQNRYVLSQPRHLPRGTVIRCVFDYDNTPHENNPDPNVAVKSGPQSTDEMFQACFEVADAEPLAKPMAPFPWLVAAALAVVLIWKSRFCRPDRS